MIKKGHAKRLRDKLVDVADFCLNAANHPDPKVRERAWVLIKTGSYARSPKLHPDPYVKKRKAA